MPEKRSVWVALVSMVDRPATALTNVAAYPRWRWVLPAALAILVLAVSLALTAPLLATQAQQQTQQAMATRLSQLPADQAAQVQARLETFQTPLFIGLMALASGIIGMAVGWLVQGTVLYYSALIAGAEIEFKRVFATVPWLSLPYVLETVTKTAYALSQGRLIVNEGLSFLVSSGKPLEDVRNLAYVALGQVSLFRLWHLILVYVFFRAVTRLRGSTAFWLTAVYTILFVGGHVALVGLSARLVPGL